MEESKSTAQTFEDLWIWQEARRIVANVYGDFRSAPADRDFGFRSQIQRAAISVMNNIAEGYERETPADFARLLTKASCGEVRSMYFVAEDLGYVSTSVATDRRTQTRRGSGGIAQLRKRVIGKHS